MKVRNTIFYERFLVRNIVKIKSNKLFLTVESKLKNWLHFLKKLKKKCAKVEIIFPSMTININIAYKLPNILLRRAMYLKVFYTYFRVMIE